MQLVDGFWTSVTFVLGFFTLTPNNGPGSQEQIPFIGSPSRQSVPNKPGSYPHGPVFKPPGGSLEGEGSDFVCDYNKTMPGFRFCSTPENRGCWLTNGTYTYDIYTDYETIAPKGVERTYELNLVDGGPYNADGLYFNETKFFKQIYPVPINAKYPGPWIQACWGDTVTVKINNRLKRNGGNGTSIHWHGIRQLNTTHMDGVNGVTQCPIAPDDYFVYTWRAIQYGSSWYHSHHSVQYADGALGPLTLHGPSSAPYDEPVAPILMTDWGHNSAFDAIQRPFGNQFDHPSILLNGIGNVTRIDNTLQPPLPHGLKVPEPYNITFDPPKQGRAKRYLIRIINTSFETSFIFSIDNHNLTVVAADFVPIHSFPAQYLLVAIGQRYHVVVEANPINGSDPVTDGNYWIRTYQGDCAAKAFPVNKAKGYERAGILRYNSKSKVPPSNLSIPWKVSTACDDADFTSLRPIVEWNVTDPITSKAHVEQLLVNFNASSTIFPLATFSLGGDSINPFAPLAIEYGDPTFLNLNNKGVWNPLWQVKPVNGKDLNWTYFGITGAPGHPIHLHGHDFAILQQSPKPLTAETLDLTIHNPPRRDVVLTTDGFVIIAFRTDNPGPWLMHCHIAFHASEGLAIQLMERQQDAITLWPSFAKSKALNETKRVCDNWNVWQNDCHNWWPGDGKACGIGQDGFSPDSGI